MSAKVNSVVPISISLLRGKFMEENASGNIEIKGGPGKTESHHFLISCPLMSFLKNLRQGPENGEMYTDPENSYKIYRCKKSIIVIGMLSSKNIIDDQ